MTETYGPNYAADLLNGYLTYVKNDDEYVKVRVSPEGGWGPFMPRDAIRMVSMMSSDPFSEEFAILRETVVKQVVKGRNVAFLLDGQTVGNMSKITDVSQDLNADPFFLEHPLYLYSLELYVMAYVVEKFTPPLKNTVPE